MKRPRTSAPPPAEPRASLRLVRCAIYTRKSSEDGLEQEFNSLDAQREAGEAYVRSQAGEGWALVTERYDDGGYTGGNTERPGLQRLLADIEAGRIDCVVVYKVDRLSRSLLDFAQMMKAFENRHVSFVSVTQQFNTATSMGRLVLNVLLSFAQFEREIISERTRDKIAATRRKGKWAGGSPVLGYDIDPKGYRLVVNADEAERVRAIFALYLEHESLLPVVEELVRRGWRNKQWRTRKEKSRGGKPFTRTNLYKLLTNVAYVGKVRYKTELHDGEHAAIVDPGVWQRVQSTLARNGRTGGSPVRNKFGALLRGLLRCVPCDCAMTPSHSTRRGVVRYRYYVCSAAQKKGWNTCPSKSVPAQQIEDLIVGQIRAIGQDRELRERVLAEAHRQDVARTAELEVEQKGLEKDLKVWHGEIRNLTTQLKPGDDNGALIGRLADLQDRIRVVEGRVKQVRDQIRAAANLLVDADDAATAMSAFDPVWGTLSPRERARVVELLVERVDFDGSKGKVAIGFRSTGIKTLARELDEMREEKRA
jgi:site-specific DNA recombinase